MHLPLAPGPLGVREREPTPPADPLPEWTQYRGEQPNSKAPHNPPPSVKPTKAAVANLLSRFFTSPNRQNDHLAHQGLPRRDHQIFPASSGASLQGSLHVPPSSSAKASSLFSPSFLFGTVIVWFLAFSPCFLFPCVKRHCRHLQPSKTNVDFYRAKTHSVYESESKVFKNFVENLPAKVIKNIIKPKLP